jgi:uncharacterized protein DUF3999
MKYLLLLIALLVLPAVAAATVQPDDFAYGRSLSLTSKGAVYRLNVPREIYATVTRDDLGDIRIFNKADMAVPHALRRPQKAQEQLELLKSLPFFPLYRQDDRTGQEGLSVRIEKGLDGAVIDVQSEENKDTDKQELTGYIIDAREFEFRVDELDIAWQAEKTNNVATVALAFSQDLTHWTTLVPQATLARMEYSGHKIRQTKIPVQSQGGGYLRLSWPTPQSRITVEKITAIRKSKTPDPVRSWATFPGASADNDQKSGVQAFEYDSAAHLPADRLRLRFDDQNTLVQAKVYSRPHPDADWRLRQSGLIYDLRFETETRIQNTLAFGPTPDRYWRVEIEEGTGAGPTDIPIVELGWLPHELLFVARGEGPFMLAYGSVRLEEEALGSGSSDLLTGIMGSDEESLIKEATLMPQTLLGGPDRLMPEPPPPPWRQWLLWFVLVIGVGFVAWMAIILGKGMNKETDSQTSP